MDDFVNWYSFRLYFLVYLSKGVPMEINDNVYVLEVKYDDYVVTPHKIFEAIAGTIIAFGQLNTSLSNMISSEIEPIIILEGIEKGSIKVLLRDALKKIPDCAIEDLSLKKILGAYLVKAKYVILEKMKENDAIESNTDIEVLENELLRIAKETDLLRLQDYCKINRKELLLGMKLISETMRQLPSGTDFFYQSESGNSDISKHFVITDDKIDELIIKREILNTQKMILKVKKPDYLGHSQWDFKHGTRLINAKIIDYNWLNKFHIREIDIRPGDSLYSNVNILTAYDENLNLVSEKYEIVEVFNVIQDNQVTEQMEI